MVEFAGYEMPVLYAGILAEARAVRQSAGLFDVSHMARFEITGSKARAFVGGVFTRDVAALQEGQVAYGLFLREDGTVIDDALVSVMPERVLVCANASNGESVRAWLEARRTNGCVIEDRTAATGMLALQGPEAERVLAPLTTIDLPSLKRHRLREGRVCDTPALVSRTGYTGENGFEITVPAEAVERVWRALLGSRVASVSPIGLGARDTLRLEAGMPLYGHEIDAKTTPIEAGLAFAIDWEHAFIGRDAVLAKRAELEGSRGSSSSRLVGFVTDSKRVPRPSQVVFAGDRAVGEVRSGTFSPALEKNIGTAYVEARALEAKDALSFEVSGRHHAMTIVPLPFLPHRNKKDRK
jgi:aminomethyltransferase